ncbi:MAG: response regulator [Pseudanabaena sp.]|jgi:two-component system response regulator|uniref:response regulator n=1 Tax=Pseudanabaena mucicola TaxID=71190 RepID=UPI000E91FD6B|nr:response regulator [Pseudanabaena mucicola]MCA6575607.1 response regulator [Pseudanabaena sp. M53BS1SP1A06MG]MCA6583212.1 response regulator [Pseudanabaena sp. M34BS1SP1A06MG]MCA6585626.1 response regulator [Pseudanabaena sp. M051S1SP1A06QC]MCA6589338.1 response regulator [Pseudanabaena sp. M109S1SP1A06QC]MCA6594266.1 response regulator [Pseudanabaena sp. M38BS1SP1A06MG]MCA6596648.1 response regulator [Pseudanabaena sp. M046S1SP1A06QC]MCA6602320.1 response regulator [Pseudanabaena sp. M57
MNNLPIVCIVEDNPDDERLTIRALRKGKIANEIKVARNGEEALNMVLNANPLPCVVLLDLKLPKIDGLEVLRRIRSDERTHLLPVVVLTSSSEDRDILESYSFGANSYVRKSVEFDRFTEAVRQLGLYWALVNEPLPKGL